MRCLVLLSITSALLPISKSGETITFPEVCPNEDAEWCTSSESGGLECSYHRSDGSVVYKLLDNVWYNCPKHCFGCKFPGDDLNVTMEELNDRRMDAQLPPVDGPVSVELVEFMLEYRTIMEAFQGPCEDAVSFGEANETDICESWKRDQGESLCQRPDMTKFDATNPREDFSTIKSGGFWWCKKTCKIC